MVGSTHRYENYKLTNNFLRAEKRKLKRDLINCRNDKEMADLIIKYFEIPDIFINKKEEERNGNILCFR